MKLRCDRIDLVDRLSSIQGIISTNSPKPILADFYLGTEGDSLIAEATDLEITGKITIHKVDISERGEVALPSSRLISIIKEVPEESLLISSREDNAGAVLEANGFVFKILGHDPAEFPRSQEPENPNTITIRREPCHDALRRVAIATSRDPTRYQLNGVYLEVEGSRIILTATDGKRLTNDFFEVENPDRLKASVIVPNRAVEVFQRVLSSPGNPEENVTLSFSDTRLTLKTRDTQISTTLIEGVVPNYRNIFPPEPKLILKGSRNGILAAAKSASLTTDKDTLTVIFKIQPDALHIESTAKNIGESKIRVPVEAIGPPMEIRFNPVYFIEALRAFEDDKVTIEFTDLEKPAVIRSAYNYRHLVMPLVIK